MDSLIKKMSQNGLISIVKQLNKKYKNYDKRFTVINIKILANLSKIMNKWKHNLINRQHKVIMFKNGDILMNYHKICID